MTEMVRSRILDRRGTGGAYYILVLSNPFSEPMRPGQFVMISQAGVGDPFLKRPYSIFRAQPKSARHAEGEIRLLIKAVGRGSRQMEELPIGTVIEVVGPLGRPFSVGRNVSLAVFIAGGVGVAPFVEFAASPELKHVRKLALIGGRGKEDIQGGAELEALGVETRAATEDGSLGKQGLATLLLEELIEEGLEENIRLYSCGPAPMMKEVGRIAAAHDLPCQLSLEARMACGFGVCLGCVVKDKNGEYVRVCREGPVFEASELSGYGEKEEDL